MRKGACRRSKRNGAYGSAPGPALWKNKSLARMLLHLSGTFHGQTLREPARRGWADRGLTAYQERKHDGAVGAPHGAVAFSDRGKTKPRQWRGLVLLRSGARRSQEQGESRMTVLPGARNRKVAGAVAIRRDCGSDIPSTPVNK